LLVVGLSVIALGGALGISRRGFSAGMLVQAVGAAGIAVAGFWALGAQNLLGDGFSNSFAPRFGVDGLTGLFLRHPRPDRCTHTRLLFALSPFEHAPGALLAR